MKDLLLILVQSLILTIVLETVLGSFLGIRSKDDLILLCMVNLLTNPVAVLTSYLARGLLPFSIRRFQIFLELIVVVVEGFYYKRYSKKIRHPWLISIVLNVSSYGCGILLY